MGWFYWNPISVIPMIDLICGIRGANNRPELWTQNETAFWNSRSVRYHDD